MGMINMKNHLLLFKIYTHIHKEPGSGATGLVKMACKALFRVLFTSTHSASPSQDWDSSLTTAKHGNQVLSESSHQSIFGDWNWPGLLRGQQLQNPRLMNNIYILHLREVCCKHTTWPITPHHGAAVMNEAENRAAAAYGGPAPQAPGWWLPQPKSHFML